MASAELSALVGSPTAAVCPPGQCQFTGDWDSAVLLERSQQTHDTILLTFGLKDGSKPLGLSTCACILAKINEEGSPDPVVRPYTPVSTNAMTGKFQLFVKVYPGGKLSGHMQNMPIGAPLEFKHIDKNVKLQYPFGKKHLTMLVGGTGITPMIQALHAVLGTPGDTTKVTMIFGNKKPEDILCKELLDSWSKEFPDRLKVVHVLSDAGEDASWTGPKGFIDQKLLSEHCAPASEDVMVMVCGPPPMYNALCGPRDKPEELTGTLSDLGFKVSQVYKF
eukprot:CAMPEP_0170599696 /NCGR_PEP_ID=MMETSP0224-20130122/16939_1 /TAXON_ID=285029 /ORGANISM="Togula jolla, Strain CCCM 725" /LENGTH=277 /DNA_ID=CAMNT_0010924373 /DNA_START=39 /DNA_END=872 /DNA_ORIENTATION=+